MRILMGTFVEVISPDVRSAAFVFEEVKRIEGIFSIYKSESEVSRLNQDGRINASRDMLYLVKKSKEFWQMSNGAFDITIGPLMDIWGFTNKQFRIPDKAEIAKALERVGFDKIIIDEAKGVIEFKAPGMRLDLGAIAAGYAVDCAISRLKREGIKDCVINAGGDIYCMGAKFGNPWTVAIRNPRKNRLMEYVKLNNEAITTSGDYHNYFIKDNKRYSHIFDPRTGCPAQSGAISVTVIAPDCLTADALATAIFVLGKKDGEALAGKIPGVQAKIIEEADTTPKEK